MSDIDITTPSEPAAPLTANEVAAVYDTLPAEVQAKVSATVQKAAEPAPTAPSADEFAAVYAQLSPDVQLRIAQIAQRALDDDARRAQRAHDEEARQAQRAERESRHQ